MTFEAATLLQLVISMTWTCLTDTPFNQKNTLFARFFISQAVLKDVASTASMVFCPGLFEMLQSATPPTIQFFKSLPTDTSSSRWGIYVVVLEKTSCRPILYIGSGTSMHGVRKRMRQYDDEYPLPHYVKHALNDGYIIVHKGLLCWIPLPTPGTRPINRLLFIALEATFAYIFWAMRTDTRDYGMAHLCLWDRNTLEYDGCCSHCCLYEPIRGDFDLPAEQLEAQAIEKEKKRLALKAKNASNYHYKQMALNPDEYRRQQAMRTARSRANKPGHSQKYQADRVEKALAAKSFHCERCNISLSTKHSLQDHEKTAKHFRKQFESDNPFKCAPCNIVFIVRAI